MKKILFFTILAAVLVVFSGCVKDTLTNSEDELKIVPQGDSVVIYKEDIKIKLEGGYKKHDTTVSFGPLSTANFGPDPSQKIEPYHVYVLRLVEQRSASEVIKSIKQHSPNSKQINNLTIVEWSAGEYCEGTYVELIGKTTNILFNSGCGTDTSEDFKYFEKIVESIEFIN